MLLADSTISASSIQRNYLPFFTLPFTWGFLSTLQMLWCQTCHWKYVAHFMHFTDRWLRGRDCLANGPPCKSMSELGIKPRWPNTQFPSSSYSCPSLNSLSLAFTYLWNEEAVILTTDLLVYLSPLRIYGSSVHTIVFFLSHPSDISHCKNQQQLWMRGEEYASQKGNINLGDLTPPLNERLFSPFEQELLLICDAQHHFRGREGLFKKKILTSSGYSVPF